MNQADNTIILWQNNNGNNQRWKLVYDSNKNAYQFKSVTNENLVLANDLNGSNNVVATSNQNKEEQYWLLNRSREWILLCKE